MRFLIDNPPSIFNLLRYQENREENVSRNPNSLTYTNVGGEAVILPDPLDKLCISFRSSGKSYFGRCVIMCGKTAPSSNVGNNLGEIHRDRWSQIGRMNRGYFLDIDKETPLLACETLEADGNYIYNICLGASGAKPLIITTQRKFIREIAGFQTFIQTSLETFLETARKKHRGKIRIPKHEIYASLTEVEYSGPEDDRPKD